MFPEPKAGLLQAEVPRARQAVAPLGGKQDGRRHCVIALGLL
ncbi:hypothetical protein [Nitratireductor soli]|nr:hypothetical protein [Nitratireductor soli]